MSYQLGIDTGGTYTDAVILNSAREVVAKNKSLTTRHDLSLGISGALSELPDDLLAATDLVALSTTLSTNSVVEGRGAPVSILLPGYNDKQIRASGLNDILAAEFITTLDGGHDATGAPLGELDTATAIKKIKQHKDSVSAFAVSALFATRNSEHENTLRDLIYEISGKPVACGHELATKLGAPRRALTAALNARMILYIQTLIAAVEKILTTKKINAPLMIVKGDGSLVNATTAQLQPVATVLSGPAASVLGAGALSGEKNAIIVDMGGTTTDIATLRDGRPNLCEGARIGDWQPMVAAMQVFSVGLGGDSEINFNGELNISHRRVVPMGLLAHKFPQVLQCLEFQWQGEPSARNNRFAIKLQQNESLLSQLNSAELKVWEKLQDAPIELEKLANNDRGALRTLAKLERMGLAIYSGFTPSDAMHVLGCANHWSQPAAELAAKIWARKMRYLYGCGDWQKGDARAACADVFELVVAKLCQTIIAAGLSENEKLSAAAVHNLTTTLTNFILPKREREIKNDNAPRLFDIAFAKKFTLVAVGAPAPDYFPRVAELLGIKLCLPKHLDTANAVGAALAAVTQTVKVTVTQPQLGEFFVFHKQTPQRFEDLKTALASAEDLAAAAARAQAEAAGAIDVAVSTSLDANHVKHDIDGELFVSATITATASGPPQRTAGSD